MKLKKPTVSQPRELWLLNTSNMVCHHQNNNWSWTGIIFNKNNMPGCYTLLKNKGNVIRINRCHLIKMALDFVKIENDNDIDNYIETKPKTRHHVSNCTWRSGWTLRECGWTSRNIELYSSGRRAIKPSPYGKWQTVKLLIVKEGCYGQPSCFIILFEFVYSTSIMFML